MYADNEQLKKELKKCIIDNGYTAKQICDSLDMLPQTYQTLINKKNPQAITLRDSLKS